jgi:hypothetical protein
VKKKKTTIQQESTEYVIHNFSSKFGIRTTTELGGKQVVCVMHKFSHSNFRNYAGVTEFPNYTKIICNPTVKV